MLSPQQAEQVYESSPPLVCGCGEPGCLLQSGMENGNMNRRVGTHRNVSRSSTPARVIARTAYPFSYQIPIACISLAPLTSTATIASYYQSVTEQPALRPPFMYATQPCSLQRSKAYRQSFQCAPGGSGGAQSQPATDLLGGLTVALI